MIFQRHFTLLTSFHRTFHKISTIYHKFQNFSLREEIFFLKTCENFHRFSPLSDTGPYHPLFVTLHAFLIITEAQRMSELEIVEECFHRKMCFSMCFRRMKTVGCVKTGDCLLCIVISM